MSGLNLGLTFCRHVEHMIVKFIAVIDILILNVNAFIYKSFVSMFNFSIVYFNIDVGNPCHVINLNYLTII